MMLIALDLIVLAISLLTFVIQQMLPVTSGLKFQPVDGFIVKL